MFAENAKEEIKQAYISENNFNRENKVIHLMITDGEKWNYLAAKNLPSLFRGKKSTHDGDYYCVNCLHSFRTEHKVKAYENICKNHDNCYIGMPEKGKNI